jgi:hypothetical protein
MATKQLLKETNIPTFFPSIDQVGVEERIARFNTRSKRATFSFKHD